MIRNGFNTLMISSAMLMCFANPAFSTSITVPDGTFNSTTNVGTVGGSILNLNGSNVQIGSSGPWTGNWSGVLGLLAPPSLTISSSSQTATISGILGVNATGIADNGGDFTTTLTSAGSGASYAYAANTVYTLTANISASTLLGVSALAADGVGIALTSGGSIIASTTTAAAGLVGLTLIDSTHGTLSLQYSTPASSGPTGAIGIELFDLPTNLVTANLLQSVSFSNVALSDAAATPEPAAFLLSGGGLIAVGFLRRRNRKRA